MINLKEKESVNSPIRILSIDILRSVTMILMIFANDLWSLNNIPSWLEHVEFGVDGIGLADVVFPAFLFIVGLSLPYGLEARVKKGDSTMQLVQHVMTRSFALLVMGVFLVNGETINVEATGLSQHAYYTLACLSFILVWTSYSKSMNKNRVWMLMGLGVLMLLILAYLYRGGENGKLEYFQPHWWGILGLIGWAYLVSGLLAIFFRNNFYGIVGSWIFFAILSMVSKAGYVPSFLSFIPDAIRGGTLTALTLGGVLTTAIFRHYHKENNNNQMTVILFGFSVVLITLSIIVRPYWGLAKLGATPAWLFLCSAFTIIAFIIVYWVIDIWGKVKWFNMIKPAGTDTLLCYLIPYFLYALMSVLGIHLPDFALTGTVGLIKSFLFAMLCAWLTGQLSKRGVRLKL